MATTTLQRFLLVSLILFHAVCTSSALKVPDPTSPAATAARRFPVLSSKYGLSYGVRILLGSQRQPFTVMVDTGSQFLWVPSFNASVVPNNNNGKKKNAEREEEGTRFSTFNPNSSSTFQSMGLKPFVENYGSGELTAVAGKDTVCFASSSSSSSLCADDIPFALGTKFSLDVLGPFDGILGLSSKSDFHRLPVGLVVDAFVASGALATPNFQVIAPTYKTRSDKTPTKKQEEEKNDHEEGGSLWLNVTDHQPISVSSCTPVITIPTNWSSDPFDWLIDVQIMKDTPSLSSSSSFRVGLDIGTSLNVFKTRDAKPFNQLLGCTTQNSDEGLCALASCPTEKRQLPADAKMVFFFPNTSTSVASQHGGGKENHQNGKMELVIDGFSHSCSSSGGGKTSALSSSSFATGSRFVQLAPEQCTSAVEAVHDPFWTIFGGPFFREVSVGFFPKLGLVTMQHR